MAHEEATKALTKTKVQLMDRDDSTFYTSLCFSLDHVWDPSIPTACTDGKTIRYNPDYFMQQTPAKQLGLMLHETEHVALQHMLRGEAFDPKKYNYAADHVINIGLTDRGFEIPDGGLCDYQYRGMYTEQVYHLLPDPPKDYQMDVVMAGGDPSDTGDPQDGAGKATELREEINDMLIRAAMQSKAAGDDPGSIPAEIRVYLEKLTNPRLPWHQILQRYCFSTIKDHTNFRKPNRRFFPDMLLPSRHSEGLDLVGEALDMSGSITDEESTHFASESYSIVKRMAPRLLKMVQFDTQVKSVDDITCVRDLARVEYHGRGGTRIQPVFDWMAENKPDVMIIFTDGFFNMPATVPKHIPTVWVIHSNPTWTAPFGKVIHYEIPRQ